MFKKLLIILMSLSAIFGVQSASAISVDELHQKMLNEERLTIIDVRMNIIYQAQHIQNAINIPASIVERKKLPPLGVVIVYGDSLDEDAAKNAVEQLNLKPGIQAQLLEGGFDAWLEKHTIIQRVKGLSSSHVRYVTYQKLQAMAMSAKSPLLIDLRSGSEQEILSEHFPNTRVYDPITTTSINALGTDVMLHIVSGIPKRTRNVLILIDDGNGFSESVADKLNAAGIKRLAILGGGEQALRARGISTEVVRSR